ncbi:MAG: YdjY domain-containing protein, partial [Nitrospirota bacterium]
MEKPILIRMLLYPWLLLLLSPVPTTWAGDAPAPPPPAPTASTKASPQPQVVDLGDGRCRIGSIDVDKTKRTFTVPGRLNLREGPLEYVAAVRGGYKLYETLVELDCDAYEFNVACLLIGLDRANSTLPKMHFDPEPVKGDPVQITVEWQQDGGTKRMNAEQLIKGFDKAPNVA